MGSIPVFADIHAPLKDFFADAPPTLVPFLRRGLAVLGGLDAQQVGILTEALKASVDSSGDIDTKELSSKLGIEKGEGNDLTTATSVLIALTLSRDDEPEAIASELVASKLAGPESERAALLLLRSLHSDRGAIRQVAELNELASEVLPAFRSLDTSLDLRLRLDKDGAVGHSVPVVIAGLTTDVSRHNTFFQIRKSDVFRLAEQFQKLKEQIEAAEKWLKREQ